jgi:hypothetical protein
MQQWQQQSGPHADQLKLLQALLSSESRWTALRFGRAHNLLTDLSWQKMMPRWRLLNLHGCTREISGSSHGEKNV